MPATCGVSEGQWGSVGVNRGQGEAEDQHAGHLRGQRGSTGVRERPRLSMPATCGVGGGQQGSAGVGERPRTRTSMPATCEVSECQEDSGGRWEAKHAGHQRGQRESTNR